LSRFVWTGGGRKGEKGERTRMNHVRPFFVKGEGIGIPKPNEGRKKEQTHHDGDRKGGKKKKKKKGGLRRYTALTRKKKKGRAGFCLWEKKRGCGGAAG